MTKIFFSDAVWSSKNLWKMISAGVKHKTARNKRSSDCILQITYYKKYHQNFKYNELFHKKRQIEGRRGWRHTVLKSPGVFHLFTWPLEIPDKSKLHPWRLCKTVQHLPWKFQDLKPRPLEIPHNFFLVTPGNFTCYFFDTPGNSISSTPLFGFFLE